MVYGKFKFAYNDVTMNLYNRVSSLNSSLFDKWYSIWD